MAVTVQEKHELLELFAQNCALDIPPARLLSVASSPTIVLSALPSAVASLLVSCSQLARQRSPGCSSARPFAVASSPSAVVSSPVSCRQLARQLSSARRHCSKHTWHKLWLKYDTHESYQIKRAAVTSEVGGVMIVLLVEWCWWSDADGVAGGVMLVVLVEWC